MNRKGRRSIKVGDYVLLVDLVWKVIKKHRSGTFQVQNLVKDTDFMWDSMEIAPHEVDEIVTKEVADVINASNVYKYTNQRVAQAVVRPII
jgi:hypothetical protein